MRVDQAIVDFSHELPQVKKASDLWNAWFGLCDCKNKPIPGGINAMKCHHKALWRKSCGQAGNRTFLRWKNDIKCMMGEQALCRNGKFLGGHVCSVSICCKL